MRPPSAACLRTLRALAFSESRSSYVFPTQCRFASTETSSTKRPTPKIESNSPKTQLDNPRPEPKPLSHPIGLLSPPQAGENTGVDTRSIRKRRDDFVNYDRHLQKRQKMTSQISRSYFKDFNDMKYSKGKIFVAPERNFKAEHALYFPNLRGRTLEGKEDQDTTDVLQGKVSMVGVFSSGWAENQIQSWVGKEENPGLRSLVDAEEGAQLVEINHENNFLKYWILRLFAYRLRAQRTKDQWKRYFVVRRGFADHLRDALLVLNQRVGFVYLLDAQCRIRWAGSAVAGETEKESMARALRRLIRENQEKDLTTSKTAQRTDSVTGSPEEPTKLPE